MAKVTFGNGVSNIAGSIGGNTYSRNRFGAYIRIKRVPVNPRTKAQTEARGRFGASSSEWRDLNDGERTAWANAAAAVVVANPGGYKANLTGSNLHTSYNTTMRLLGLSLAATPPAVDSAGIVTEVTMILDASDELFEIDAGTTSGMIGTDNILVFATAPFSPGVSFVKPSAYRYVGKVTQTQLTAGISLSAQYAAVFGSLIGQGGQKIALRFVPLSANQYRGVPLEFSQVITP